MSGTHDCGADAAAYALGALEPDEAERFRAHLDECVVCRDELTAFQQVAGALPMAAPQYRTPRGLRRRVLTQVRTEARAATESSRAPRASPRLRPAWAGARPGWAGALAGAVAVAVVVVIAVGSGGSGTRVISASRGDAQLRVSGGHGELVVNHLPAPSAGDIYEVWVVKGTNGAAEPTKALFSVTRNGAADVDVPGSVRGVSTVMVTQEPAGGSPHPTSPAVIVANL
jgi:anti-sigma-K factor RskA